jgi:hypothetical protein
MHSRQLPAKAGNCGYAKPFGAMKKKKRDFKLSQNSKNENYHFEFNK